LLCASGSVRHVFRTKVGRADSEGKTQNEAIRVKARQQHIHMTAYMASPSSTADALST
jgi:hypothetical protein